MAEDRSIRVRLIADIRSYQQGLAQAGRSTADFGKQVSGMGTAASADIERVGRSALVLSAGMALALGAAAKAAIDWESAWAGVTKTVDGTTQELATLEQGLRNMAKELPASHEEIAGVAEAAGQLGVGVRDVESFTKVMIDLGETTNLTAADAATALARISNIMGTSARDVERMGSTIVELGNNSATTEREIVELSTRLAAAGQIAGLSEADVFAFASTLTSVGVEAEAGGTALSKVFTKIRDAVIDGDDALDTFAETAGVSSQEFAAAFGQDPARAIEMFISGMGRVSAAGESTTAIFSDLELTDQRLMRAILSTASAGELLSDQLGMAARAWEENEALATEAEKRYETTAAQMEMLRNQVTDLAIDLGSSLLPAIRAVADVVGTMVEGFASLPDPVKNAAVAVGLLSTGLLATVGVIGTLAPKIEATHKALMKMGTGGQFVARNMGRMGAVLGIAGLAVAAFAYHQGQQAKKAEEARERMRGYAEAMRETGSILAGARSEIDRLAQEFPDLTEAMGDAGVSVDDLGFALRGTDEQWEAMRTRMLDAAEAAGASGFEIEAMGRSLDAQRTAALDAIEHNKNYEDVTGDAGDAAATAAPQVGELAHQLGLSAEEAKEARDEFNELLDAYRASVDPLFAMLDALESNREALGAEAEWRKDALEKVAEAGESVAEAEAAVREARGKDDNAEGIAAAEELLADARERLTKAQQDAQPSEEQVLQWHQDAAKSALDLETRARELAAAIREQPALLDDAVAMLREWRDQGSITVETAEIMEDQFLRAAGAAGELAGDWVAEVYLVGGDEMEARLDSILEKIGLIEGGAKYSAGAAYNQWVAEQERRANYRDDPRLQMRASGGPYRPGWVLTGENGPELEYRGLPGKVFNAEDTALLGAMFHGGMLQTPQMHPAAMSMSSSVDQSKRVTVNAPITVSDQRTAGDVFYRLRQLEMST